MLAIGRPVTMLSGYAPALPTPFRENGTIDFAAFERFCEIQIAGGATALIVCGTTGEAPTLNPDEQRELVGFAAKVVGGRVPVIAGAGSNSTAHAVELTKDAEAAGADAILSVVPYYNKPTQTGLYEHFRAVGAATGLPVILYDVPSRTVCGLADVTVARLAENPRFAGLKDATGDLTRLARLRSVVPPSFRLLSGDDATAPAFLASGGDGCISVTSNLAPALCRNMFSACKQDQLARARQLAQSISKLTEILFCETNPGPLKYALSLLSLMSPRLRLPLVEPAEEARTKIEVALKQFSSESPNWMIGAICAPTNRRNGVRTA